MKSLLTLLVVFFTTVLTAQVNLLPSIGLDTGEEGKPTVKVKGWHGPLNMASYSGECPPGIPFSKS
ncbi:MAG: hypothetical protein IJS15_09220, partial [Victivallales bacterium]|nr:hypothetical protein [Victivallales bacterium]